MQFDTSIGADPIRSLGGTRSGWALPPGRTLNEYTRLSTNDRHMTEGFEFDEAIRSAEDFEAALGQLLRAASENGIDPQGSWTYRNDRSTPDWEALVVTLEKEDAGSR